MKKILTLLVMFLATASILTAQTPQPRLNYQMIVRNQCPNDANNDTNNYLIVKTQVQGVLSILYGNETYTMNFNETTNMNGMLSLEMTNADNVLLNIDWSNARVAIDINTYCIHDTVEILPVPYALNVLTDSSITTPRIVKYIDSSVVQDVKDINAAIRENTGFLKALRDTVANDMKRNPSMVKQLTLYFLGKVDSMDLVNAYDTISDETMEYLTGKIKTYAKAHKDDAYDVLRTYLNQTTTDDVDALWDALMEADGDNNIIDTLVMRVNQYIVGFHRNWIENSAKYAADHVTVGEISNVYNYLKTHNEDVYNDMKDILNSYIDHYMDSLNYQKNNCNGQPINPCELKAEMDHYAQYRDVECPSFGQTSVNNNIAETPIILPTTTSTFPLSEQGHYWYELTFPYSTYDPVTVDATLVNGTNGYVITANLSDYQHYKYVLRAKMEQPCMDLATYGENTSVDCQDCLCPEIAPNSFSYTSTAAAYLSNNQGVKLTAKLTNHYNTGVNYGFQVSTDNGEHWDNLTVNPTLGPDGLTFVDTVKMKYCDKQVKVRAYVTCNNNTVYSANVADFRLREFKLEISQDPTQLIATNGIHISTQAYINAFNGNSWPSVEQINEKYSSTFGVSVEPTYEWFTSEQAVTGNDVNGNILKNYLPNTQYTVKCSFSIFNSEPCVLEATYTTPQ